MIKIKSIGTGLRFQPSHIVIYTIFQVLISALSNHANADPTCALLFSEFNPAEVLSTPVQGTSKTSPDIFKQYPFIKEGPAKASLAKLVIEHKLSVRAILARLLKKEPTSLIVTDNFNYQLLKHDFPQSALFAIEINSPDEVARIYSDARFQTAKLIIGVGGGAALDTAKALGVHQKRLIVMPTILSTNCISTNRSVLGKGKNATSYRSSSPEKTIVSIADLLAQNPQSLALWSSAGFGDHLAGVSSAIDHVYLENAAAGANLSIIQARTVHPEAFNDLDWINQSFTGFNQSSLVRLAESLHRDAKDDLDSGSSAHRVGGEHHFYRAMLELFPKTRLQGLPHGHVVAIGTMITAKIFEVISGDPTIFNHTKEALSKLGIPIKYSEMGSSLTREQIIQSLKLVSTGTIGKASLISKYFEEKPIEPLIDLIFSN